MYMIFLLLIFMLILENYVFNIFNINDTFKVKEHVKKRYQSTAHNLYKILQWLKWKCLCNGIQA